MSLGIFKPENEQSLFVHAKPRDDIKKKKIQQKMRIFAQQLV